METEKVYYYTYIAPTKNETGIYMSKKLTFTHEWTDYEKKVFFKRSIWNRIFKKIFELYNKLIKN